MPIRRASWHLRMYIKQCGRQHSADSIRLSKVSFTAILHSRCLSWADFWENQKDNATARCRFLKILESQPYRYSIQQMLVIHWFLRMSSRRRGRQHSADSPKFSKVGPWPFDIVHVAVSWLLRISARWYELWYSADSQKVSNASLRAVWYSESSRELTFENVSQTTWVTVQCRFTKTLKSQL